MRNVSKTTEPVIMFAVVFAGLIYALFHGYFDHGKFEVKQVRWSSASQVAMVAERSDQQAMSRIRILC